MNENPEKIKHRKYCLCSKDLEMNYSPSQNSSSNSKLLLNSLKCLTCNQITELKINKENYSFSFICPKCELNKDLIKNNENNKDIINYNKLRNAINNKEYPAKSDFYCQNKKHKDSIYIYYCKKCNINICEFCAKREHLNHQSINLNSILPEQNEIFINKIKIRKKKEKNKKLITKIIETQNEINNEINKLIDILQNYFLIEEYIINNYNINRPNKNYNYIQNFISTIKNLEIYFPKLESFTENSNSNFEIRSNSLLEIINILKKNYPKEKNEENKENDINNILNSSKIYFNNNNINNKISKTFNKININKQNCNINKYQTNDNINKFKRRIEVLNYSLDDTRKQNEELEGNKKIGDEHVKLIKFIGETKCINKDNNIIYPKLDNNINNIKESNFNILENSNNNNINNNIISNYESSNNMNNNSSINNNINNNEIADEGKENNDNNRNLLYNLELKNKTENKNIIKSIEFLDNNHLLICDSSFLNIYEINYESYNLKFIYYIKDISNNINYSKKLKNGNIIICTINEIIIMKKKKEKKSNLYKQTKIQTLTTKGYNINKIIEISNKSCLISCDKNYITKFKKNSNNQYIQTNSILTENEIKCIEYINDDVFVSVIPESNVIIFYDLDDINNNYYIIEKIYTIHGRYIISNTNELNCIFFASNIGVYIISNINYKLLSIYKLDDWISALYFDCKNMNLICGGINEKDINNKNYNLTIYSVEKNDSEEDQKNKIKLISKGRIDNICNEDITAINCFNKTIIIGSNDKTIQLCSY